MSTTKPFVEAFGEAMEYKLSLNRHKGDREGWVREDILKMFKRLDEEVEELKDEVMSYSNSENVLYEAADVANIAMMIADIYKERHH